MTTSVHPIDVYVEHHGSICLIRSNTPEASDWIDEHCVSAGSLYYGDALVAEPRYVPAIVQGLQEDGFSVAAA